MNRVRQPARSSHRHVAGFRFQSANFLSGVNLHAAWYIRTGYCSNVIRSIVYRPIFALIFFSNSVQQNCFSMTMKLVRCATMVM